MSDNTSRTLLFVGLGRMGGAMTAHLVERGFTVHGSDPDANARAAAAQSGVQVHDSLTEAVAALGDSAPRTVWIMVPSRFVDELLKQLSPLLTRGDTVIDGGNSFFKDSINRHHDLLNEGIRYIDCGTSGGVSGARFGASLMVGGETAAVTAHTDLFTALAIKDGYGHVGGPGAGHFVKMVHNGIEYGMMGAIAEGLNVLHEHKDGMDLDIHEVLKPYQHGSIVASNLMNWMADAYHTEGYLARIAGEVPHGETEIEMEYLTDHETIPVIKAAVSERQATRKKPSFTGTLIAAMRNQFGGHATIAKKAEHEHDDDTHSN